MPDSLAGLDLDESLIDESRLHAYRLGRVQDELRARGLAALLTYVPVNTRYATGVRNMQVWALHSLVRPGRSFSELSARAFQVPERYRAQTIAMNWHGVSLYGGWPTILGPVDN